MGEGQYGKVMKSKMKIYVDIDETICFYSEDRDHYKDYSDYSTAVPDCDNIAKINKLHDEGHKITYWSARGASTGIVWTELTKSQLKEWGCKHHELKMNNKPHYDLLICDKTKRIEEI